MTGMQAATVLEIVEPTGAQITLRQVWADYQVYRPLRGSSLETYNKAIVRLSDWLDLPLWAITPQKVKDRHRLLAGGGPRGPGKAMSNQVMRILKALINFAQGFYDESGQGEANPINNPVRVLSKCRLWHKVPRRGNIIPEHQMAGWFQAVIGCGNRTIRDYLLLLLLCGLRREEAAGLRWSDVDLAAGTLTVDGDRAKNGHEHKIPLADFTWQMLKERRELLNDESDTGFVFPGREPGTHLTDGRKTYAKIMAASGTTFILHDLRRCYQTYSTAIGINHYVQKRLMNHSSGGDVTAGYTCLTVEMLREPQQQICNKLLRLGGL